MVQSTDGSIWFAAHDRGLIRRRPDGAFRRFTKADGLPETDVYSVAADPRGGVLVAARHGLARIDGDVVKPFRPPAGAAVKDVTHLAFRSDGTLVLGSDTDGMAVVRPDGSTLRPGPPVGNRVSTLHVAPDGTIWVGGQGWGAAALRPGRGMERLSRDDGLPSENVNGILVDSRGTLWVATERGLFSRDGGGKVRTRDLSSGLPDSYVYWVGEDREGIRLGRHQPGCREDRPVRRSARLHDERRPRGERVQRGRVPRRSRRARLARDRGALALPGRAGGAPAREPPLWRHGVRVGEKNVPVSASLRLPASASPADDPIRGALVLRRGCDAFRYRFAGLSDSVDGGRARPGGDDLWALGPGDYVFEVDGATVDGPLPRGPGVVPREGGGSLVAGSGRGRGRRPRLWSWAAVRRAYPRTPARGGTTAAGGDRRREDRRAAPPERAALRARDHRPAHRTPEPQVDPRAGRGGVLAGETPRLPFALAMVDFDHFKEINDTLGHAEGDRLLVEGARRMMRIASRTEDGVGRYGGEEFLAVFPMTGRRGARRSASGSAAPWRGCELSSGRRLRSSPAADAPRVASASPSSPSGTGASTTSFARADRRALRAKQAGRNRVVYLDGLKPRLAVLTVPVWRRRA